MIITVDAGHMPAASRTPGTNPNDVVDPNDPVTGKISHIFDNASNVVVEEHMKFAVIVAMEQPASIFKPTCGVRNFGLTRGHFVFGSQAHAITSRDVEEEIEKGETEFAGFLINHYTENYIELLMINRMPSSGGNGSSKDYFLEKGYCTRITYHDDVAKETRHIITDENIYIMNDNGKTIRKINNKNTVYPVID